MRSRVCGKWLILVAILVAGSDASFAVAYMYGITDGIQGRMEVVLRSAPLSSAVPRTWPPRTAWMMAQVPPLLTWNPAAFHCADGCIVLLDAGCVQSYTTGCPASARRPIRAWRHLPFGNLAIAGELGYILFNIPPLSLALAFILVLALASVVP